MLDVSADPRRSARPPAGPPLDFQAHLAALEAQGLLVRVDRSINKDTELHPLVRWQFQGGLAEGQRRAFLFTNVTDSSGRRYDIPVAVGALAASPQIYAICMGRPVQEIEAAWVHAIAFGGTVDVFGMIARSDDLIHADRHGAVVIPREVAREVVKAAELCARREEPILKVARSPDFSLDALERAMAEAAEIH